MSCSCLAIMRAVLAASSYFLRAMYSLSSEGVWICYDADVDLNATSIWSWSWIRCLSDVHKSLKVRSECKIKLSRSDSDILSTKLSPVISNSSKREAKARTSKKRTRDRREESREKWKVYKRKKEWRKSKKERMREKSKEEDRMGVVGSNTWHIIATDPRLRSWIQ